MKRISYCYCGSFVELCPVKTELTKELPPSELIIVPLHAILGIKSGYFIKKMRASAPYPISRVLTRMGLGDKSILWELQKCGLKAPSYKGGDMHDDS